MDDINFDELKNLIFQCEIIYKKKNGGKYVRVISKNLKVSDNKEEIENKTDFEIISTMEIQKTAKLASQGLYSKHRHRHTPQENILLTKRIQTLVEDVPMICLIRI